MTFLRRQQTSLDAYLTLLNSKGVHATDLARRRELLEKLLPFLARKPVRGEYYRSAVDEAMPSIDKNDWPFFLNVVRDFYHFWINDFKAIAAMHKGGAFELSPELPKTPEGSLQDLWGRLDSEKFGVTEKWTINAYKAALRNQDIGNEIIEIRLRLAQLLLLQLRQTEAKDGRAYRLAAESMLPVFAKRETAELFIGVVREFFHFWLGDPNAAECISTRHPDGYNTLW